MMTRTGLHPDVVILRAFNRTYTRQFGFLSAHLDNSPFTLTEARILYEIATRENPTAADIMRTLDLDRGQVSRTLQRFAGRGLVETWQPAEGGRRRPVSLMAAGRKAFSSLERDTNKAIGSLLNALHTDSRSELISSASNITRIFEGTRGTHLLLRDLKPGDAGWITYRQAVLYAEEYGWNAEYEALVGRILSDFVQSFDLDHDAGWVAESDGKIVGSVFLVRGDQPKIGKLRLLYVEPSARGAGVGARLVDACIERAKAVGDERLTLWTNSVLAAARRIYERAGFRLVDEAPHHSFGKDLIGQTWDLDLTRMPVENRMTL